MTKELRARIELKMKQDTRFSIEELSLFFLHIF